MGTGNEVRLHRPAAVLTVREAADRLHVCDDTVYELVKSGELGRIPALGKRVLIAEAELDRFIHRGVMV